MEVLSVIAQLIVAVSVLVVWVFRFDNIVKEFKQYELSDLTRMIVEQPNSIISDIAYRGYLVSFISANSRACHGVPNVKCSVFSLQSE
jgi:methionine aminopeptidase